jgi:SAM-dependent methyltransferase
MSKCYHSRCAVGHRLADADPQTTDLACGTGRYTALLSSFGASSVIGYDISTTMIASANAAYPSSSHPNIHFAVRDCSVPADMLHDTVFDIVFAGWFLNYAGTEKELVGMFRVIEQNLAPGGRFLGITTNAHDELMHLSKIDFYGLDVLVLDAKYVAPDTGKHVGITARVCVNTETPFHFDVFQFRRDVYERCAESVGLRLFWRELVLPEDERRESGFWQKFLERPTFDIVEAVRI